VNRISVTYVGMEQPPPDGHCAENFPRRLRPTLLAASASRRGERPEQYKLETGKYVVPSPCPSEPRRSPTETSSSGCSSSRRFRVIGGNELERPSPAGLRHVEELVGHQETLRARASTLRYALAQSDRRERQLDHVGSAPVPRPARGQAHAAKALRVLPEWAAPGPRSGPRPSPRGR